MEASPLASGCQWSGVQTNVHYFSTTTFNKIIVPRDFKNGWRYVPSISHDYDDLFSGSSVFTSTSRNFSPLLPFLPTHLWFWLSNLSLRSLQLKLPNNDLTFFASFTSPAWQSQDIAPTSSGIIIPTDAALNNGVAMITDDQNWSNGNGRSPVRDRNGGEPPRRSSRSRSPVAPREGERGLVLIFGFGFHSGSNGTFIHNL